MSRLEYLRVPAGSLWRARAAQRSVTRHGLVDMGSYARGLRTTALCTSSSVSSSWLIGSLVYGDTCRVTPGGCPFHQPSITSSSVCSIEGSEPQILRPPSSASCSRCRESSAPWKHRVANSKSSAAYAWSPRPHASCRRRSSGELGPASLTTGGQIPAARQPTRSALALALARFCSAVRARRAAVAALDATTVWVAVLCARAPAPAAPAASASAGSKK